MSRTCYTKNTVSHPKRNSLNFSKKYCQTLHVQLWKTTLKEKILRTKGRFYDCKLPQKTCVDRQLTGSVEPSRKKTEKKHRTCRCQLCTNENTKSRHTAKKMKLYICLMQLNNIKCYKYGRTLCRWQLAPQCQLTTRFQLATMISEDNNDVTYSWDQIINIWDRVPAMYSAQ